MKWFHFSCGAKKDEKGDMELNSFGSYSNTSTDYGLRSRRSGSGLNSQNISDVSVSSVERPQYPNSSEQPKDLRIFTYPELKTATRNFSRSTMVGEGGFGCVYRGIIKDPEDSQRRIEIAVKQLSRSSQQGHKEWSAEVNVLGIAEHPNLVKLIGYCTEDDERGIQRLLVYEFMPNKSVFDHLSSKSPVTISWQMRLKAALDAARGLTYLHEEMDFQIIFRDFKTSNILLDEEWNAKLSDFGLARHGPAEGLSHVSTTVVGSPGYAAPEYMQTGRLTAKSDIWSYGVVLYELITGRPPIDKNRPKGEQKLLEWIRPYLSDSKKFRLIVDPRLDGQYTLKSALKLGVIANKCLMRAPKSRPKMSQVMEMVKEIVDSTVTGPPQPPLLTVASKNNALEESKAKKMEQKETCFREGKRVYLKRKISQLKVVEEYFPWRLWKTKRGASS